MTKREMLSLAIKLMGIYVLVLFVPTFVQSLGTLALTQLTEIISKNYFDSLMTIATSIVVQLLWMGFCVCIICKSDRIAGRLFPEDSPAGQLTTLSFYEFQILGFQFIGLVTLLRGLSGAVDMINHLGFLSSGFFEEIMPGIGQTLSEINWAGWTRIAFQTIIGLTLFLYSRSLADLWKRLQGKKWPPNNESNSIEKEMS